VRAILAVLLLLAAAPAAQARSFSVSAPAVVPSDPVHTSTLALATGEVVWLEQRGAGVALVAATPEGVRRELAALPPAVSRSTRVNDLTADGGVALVQRLVCRTATCARPLADDSVRVDLTTGAATPFDPCPSPQGTSGYALRAGLLTCRAGTVIDLGDGSSHRVDERLVAAAGRYAVIAGTDHLRVVDWRTGAQIRRVRDVHLSPLAADVGLGEDGTLAWAGDGRIQVLRPGARRPRPVGNVDEFLNRVQIAGSRLAVRGISDDGTSRVTVSGLDRRGSRSVDGQAQRSHDPGRTEFGWAFDGARVAWVAQPCALPTIQVWDLAEDPPARVSEKCGATQLPAGPLKLSTSRRALGVAATCPAVPADGCAGELSAEFFAGGRQVGDGYLTAFTVPAGTTKTVRVKVVSPRKLRGGTGLTAVVSLSNSDGTFTDRRFRVQG